MFFWRLAVKNVIIWGYFKEDMPRVLYVGLILNPYIKEQFVNWEFRYHVYTSVELLGGGRVVRWSWVNFQYRGVLQFGW